MPLSIITPDQAAQLLINAFVAIALGGFAGAPIVEFLVSLLKRIPQLANVSAGAMSTVTALLLTVVFWVAQSVGAEAQFRSVVDAVLTIGPAVVTLLATLTGASMAHSAFAAMNVPLIGYSRTPQKAEAQKTNRVSNGG